MDGARPTTHKTSPPRAGVSAPSVAAKRGRKPLDATQRAEAAERKLLKRKLARLAESNDTERMRAALAEQAAPAPAEPKPGPSEDAGKLRLLDGGKTEPAPASEPVAPVATTGQDGWPTPAAVDANRKTAALVVSSIALALEQVPASFEHAPSFAQRFAFHMRGAFKEGKTRDAWQDDLAAALAEWDVKMQASPTLKLAVTVGATMAPAALMAATSAPAEPVRGAA